MTDTTTAYPLCWPAGWPRTPIAQRKSAYQRFGRNLTVARARDRLLDELGRLGVRWKSVILSTNLELRQDGLPRSNQRQPIDGGVAVYFERNRQPMVMARDAWTTVEANLASLALAVEHLRGLERHGGAIMMERAFTGFQRLTDRTARPWWVVLGVRPDAGRDTIEAAFRQLAMQHHPDRGGTTEDMMELTRARDEALASHRGAAA